MQTHLIEWMRIVWNESVEDWFEAHKKETMRQSEMMNGDCCKKDMEKQGLTKRIFHEFE